MSVTGSAKYQEALFWVSHQEVVRWLVQITAETRRAIRITLILLGAAERLGFLAQRGEIEIHDVLPPATVAPTLPRVN
jgi:hypothetical protein